MTNNLLRGIFLCWLVMLAGWAHAQSVYQEVFQALSKYDHRNAGSQNLRDAQETLKTILKKHGLEFQEQTFNSLAHRNIKTELTVNGKTIDGVMNMGPNGFVLSSTGKDPVVGPLVHVGNGSSKEIDGLDLDGAIVLINLTSPHWPKMYLEGAHGLIFIGESDAGVWDTEHLFPKVIAQLPRGYISRAKANAQGWLKATGRVATKASLTLHASWEDYVARNLWTTIEPETPEKMQLDLPEAMVFSAEVATSGIVPDYTPDLRRLANAALTAELAVALKRQGVKRRVYILFLDNSYGMQESARWFYWAYRKSKNQGTDKFPLDLRLEGFKEEKKEIESIIDLISQADLFADVEHPARFETLKRMRTEVRNLNNLYNIKIRDLKLALRSKTKEEVDIQVKPLEEVRDAWNNMRRVVAEKKLDPESKPYFDKLMTFLKGQYKERLAALDLLVAHNATHQALESTFKEVEVVSHYHLDLARTDLPFFFNGASRAPFLIKGNRIQGGNFLALQTSLVELHKKMPEAKRPGVMLEDAMGGQYYDHNLVTYYERVTPAAVSSGAGVPGLTIYNAGDSLDQDEMPVRENVDLRPWAKSMVAYLSVIVDAPEMSQRSRVISKNVDQKFMAQRKGGKPAGYKVDSYLAGSQDVAGPAVGAIAATDVTTVIKYPTMPGRSWYAIGRVDFNGYMTIPNVRVDRGWRPLHAVAFDGHGYMEQVGTEGRTPRTFHGYGGMVFIEFNPSRYDFPTLLNQIRGKNDAKARLQYKAHSLTQHSFYSEIPDKIKFYSPEQLILGTVEDSTKRPEGNGISNDRRELYSLDTTAQMANDLTSLNDFRLNRLKQKNIINDSVETLHLAARTHLKKAKKAKEKHNSLLSRAHNAFAMVLAHRAYNPLKTISNDMIQAVVILLLLSIPFSFAMERLVFGFPSIYKQVGGFIGVFVVTFVTLYMVHPAFSLAQSPMVIFLAFCIVLMSALVIYIIMGKFKSELMKLQGMSSKSHGTQKESSTAMAAVLIGIAGMRNRPLKTGLTAVTIILLTFTILAFSSFTSQTGVVEQYLGQAKGKPRIEVHRQSLLDLPTGVAESIRALYSQDYHVIERHAAMFNPISIDHQPEYLALITSSNKIQKLEGLMSFDPVELQQNPAIRKAVPSMTPGENALPPLYLSEFTAKDLGLKTGETIIIHGQAYRYAGPFNSEKLLVTARINDMPIIPPDFKETLKNQGQGESFSDENALEQMDTSSFIFNPIDLIGITTLNGLKSKKPLRTDMVLYPKHEDVDLEKDASSLAQFFAEPVHVTSALGAKKFFFTQSLQGSGFSEVLVPLLLGGLIIFSSLMGSIVDREKEIFTYSALGLAPPDVGMLFFAESAVYSVVGGMGGYMFSQIIAKLLSLMAHWGLFTAPEMNFSSLSSILTILLVMAVVILSTIYPAIKAGKSANPGVARKWRMPNPEDGNIKFVFPFTVSSTDLKGILAFIKEHFDNHRDASLGLFAAHNTRIYEQSLDGDSTLGLQATLSLAPFDLGVSQDFKLYSQNSDIEGIREIVIEIEKENGSPGAWIRGNRNFVDDLRNQFLLWRSLDVDTIEHYRQATQDIVAT